MKKLLLIFSLLWSVANAQQIKVMYVDSAGYNRIASFNLPQVAISGQYTNLTAKPTTILVTSQFVAINATATATAAQLAVGTITSTSAAATTITLPTATLLATQLGATRGTIFDFVIDNSVGANIVTVALGSGMTALAVITGSNTLTTAAAKVGIFRIYFISTTAAFIVRLG